MHELLTQILPYIQGMWRFRWVALLIAWIVCLAGWVFVYSLPDEYKSQARVYVDTQSVLRPLLRGLAVESNVDSRVVIMTRTLLTRPNLQKVARETDLDLRATTPQAMEGLLTRMQQRTEVSGSHRDDNLYTISHTDTDPVIAQRVVQALVNRLVESTLGSSREDTVAAQKFLDGQILEYEKRLTESEARLAEFKKKHVGLMPSEGRGYYARLQGALDKLQQTESTLRVAEERRAELRKQLENEQRNIGPTGPSEIDQRIQERQKELDALLLRYTDQHPDIRALRQTITQLETRRDAEQATTKEQRERSLRLNPVYQAVKIELSKAEVEIAALKGQLADQQREITELRRMVDTIPEVEAELVRLDRDYAITKSQYEALVQRRESARLSEQADQKTDDIRFRIVDPPILPRAPAGPNRFRLLTVVLFAGLALGGGLAFLLNELRPVFVNSRMLREATGLPVLGSVSMKWMPPQRLKLRVGIASFVVATTMLLFAYGSTVLFAPQGTRLTQAVLGSI